MLDVITWKGPKLNIGCRMQQTSYAMHWTCNAWGQACNELQIIKCLQNSWNPDPIDYVPCVMVHKSKYSTSSSNSRRGIPHRLEHVYHCMTRHWNKRQRLLSQLMREKYTIHSFHAPICFSNPFLIYFVSRVVLKNKGIILWVHVLSGDNFGRGVVKS